MFDPRSLTKTSARMMMIVFAVLLIGGCSSDGGKNPLSPTQVDQAPPLSPVGLGIAQQTAAKFTVRWSPNVEPDLAGYRLYLYDPSPERDTAYRCVSGPATLGSPRMTYAGVSGMGYTFRVTAIDTSGNESAMSDPFTFTFTPFNQYQGSTLPDEEGGRGAGTSSAGGHDWLPGDFNDTER